MVTPGKFAPNVFKDKIPFAIDVREREKTRKVRSSRMFNSLAGLYLRCLAGGGRVQASFTRPDDINAFRREFTIEFIINDKCTG